MMKILTLGFVFGTSVAQGFVLSFDSGDFTTTPTFSNVTTFDFTADVAEGFRTGSFADPALDTIGYNVSGSLAATPSGFSGFSFQLSHLIAPPPAGPTVIPGITFYSLNPGALTGDRLSFEIAPGADFSDGLQISDLLGVGSDVVFRFDGREVGTGRYHPTFIELRADGTGTIQNSNNTGGDNPQDGFVGDIDVDFGEEYITNLTFDPATFTIAAPVPEPSVSLLSLIGISLLFGRRRSSRRMI